MPRGDGTGPAGMGPRTGRGMGYCTGFQTPGWQNVARTGLAGFGAVASACRWAMTNVPRLGRRLGTGRGGGGRRSW